MMRHLYFYLALLCPQIRPAKPQPPFAMIFSSTEEAVGKGSTRCKTKVSGVTLLVCLHVNLLCQDEDCDT